MDLRIDLLAFSMHPVKSLYFIVTTIVVGVGVVMVATIRVLGLNCQMQYPGLSDFVRGLRFWAVATPHENDTPTVV